MPTRIPNPKTYPVHSLREQCTGLEAAIELVLARPRKKSVHQVRTHTRRIEALLELLCLLAPTNPRLRFSRKTRKLQKLLKDIRKAAGKVRDLDVQRDLIKEAAEDDAQKNVHKDAKQLRKTLKTYREREAGALLHELRGHTLSIGPTLEKLLDRLAPAMDLAVSQTRLTNLIRAWYTQRAGAFGTSGKDLHNIRKAAKLARYMAETGSALSVASEFENIQQLGGNWHDALTLHRIAHQHLGNNSQLVASFATREQGSLTGFRAALESHADQRKAHAKRLKVKK